MTDTPVARHSDPDTSHQAAASITPASAATCRHMIYATLSTYGPLTDEQIAHHLAGYRFSESGMRTRRAELVASGLVTDSGVRDRTASGRKAIVWRITTTEERNTP